MTLSLRQWSDHVWAFYRDDGNPFGPRLEYVADSRETVALQAILADGGYDRDTGESLSNRPVSTGAVVRPDTTLPTPAGPDRSNLSQQGERL
jgi:hypothetical protein